MKSVNALQLQTERRKVVNKEGVVPLFIRMSGLGVRAWLVIVKNLAVDVQLRTAFIQWCTWSNFPTKHNVFHWHSREFANNSTKTWINSIYADITQSNINSNPENDSPSDGYYWGRIMPQVRYRNTRERLYWGVLKPLGSWPLRCSAICLTPMFHDCKRSTAHSIWEARLRLCFGHDG